MIYASVCVCMCACVIGFCVGVSVALNVSADHYARQQFAIKYAKALITHTQRGNVATRHSQRQIDMPQTVHTALFGL